MRGQKSKNIAVVSVFSEQQEPQHDPPMLSLPLPSHQNILCAADTGPSNSQHSETKQGLIVFNRYRGHHQPPFYSGHQ